MNKGTKVFLGVLSVGSLVGTGFASWIVNKGYTETKTNPIQGVATEILDNAFGKITVTAIDDHIKFDAPNGSSHGLEDLSVIYKVKAEAHTGEDIQPYDPYDLSLYDGVSEDYLPYLNVSTLLVDESRNALSEDKQAEILEMITLPSTVIDYTEWLSQSAKNNGGYEVNLDFGWGEKFVGVNPQIYYDSKEDMTASEKRTAFEDIVETLGQAYFIFEFKVGYYGTHPEGQDERGTISTDADAHVGLTYLVNGVSVSAGASLRVGTVVDVRATLASGYELATLTHNGTNILETKQFTIVEGVNTIVATSTPIVIPATSVKATLSASTINVGEKATLSVSDDLDHAITYSVAIANETIASYNAETKEITGLSAGTTTITVSSEGLTSATLNLTVNAVATRVLATLDNSTIKVGETATLTIKDDLGATLDTYTVTEKTSSTGVEITGSTVKGVTAGSYILVVSSGTLTSAEVTLTVETEPVVEPITIKKLIEDGDTTTEVSDLNCLVVYSKASNHIIYDGTGVINFYGSTFNYEVGSFVKVSGQRTLYFGTLQFKSDISSATDGVEDESLVTSWNAIQTTTLTDELLETHVEGTKGDNDSAIQSKIAIYTFELTATSNKTGTYAGKTYSFVDQGPYVSFTKGRSYKIKALLGDTNASGSPYKISMYVLEYEIIDVPATSVGQVTVSKTTANVNDVVTVTAQDNLGNSLDTYLIELESDSVAASVDNTAHTITCTTAGTVKFKVTSGTLVASEVKSITVSATPIEDTTLYSFDFTADNNDTFGAPSTYKNASYTYNDNGKNLIFSNAMYNADSKYKCLCTGTNKAANTPDKVSSALIKAVADNPESVTEDSYKAIIGGSENYIYSLLLDFELDDVRTIELEVLALAGYSSYTVHLLESADGSTWTKIDSKMFNNTTYSFTKDESSIHKAKYAFVFSTTIEKALPLSSLTITK